MAKYVLIIVVCVLGISNSSLQAQSKYSRQDYIQMYSKDAVREMQQSGVPASITLAQGILESSSGNSELARKANNHFGIKCHSDWSGPTFTMDDDKRNECFRKYKSVYHSYDDHSKFLSTKSRYAFLFDLAPTDYKAWARGLKKAGYATNPKYADLLIRIIEDESLYKYDGMLPIENDAPVVEQPKKSQPEKPKPQSEIKPTSSANYIKLHENNIKYVVAQKGDTYFQIARRCNVDLWQIYKYNDLSKTDVLYVGDIIYLQPKRRKAKADFHVVRQGETVRQISQVYGIKMKHIYKKNGLIPGAAIKPGQKLKLR